MNLLENFKKSFVDDLSDFTKELAETTLDSVIDNPILQNIPVVQGCIAFYKMGIGIRERHNIKKILQFLNSLSTISLEEKEDFIKKLNSENQSEEIFERVLVILDRLDEEEKASILGNLFKLYVYEIITKDKFLRLAAIVEKSYLSDLKAFYKILDVYDEFQGYDREADKIYSSYEAKINLYNLGLLKQLIKTEQNSTRVSEKYSNTIRYETSNLGFAMAICMYYTESKRSKTQNLLEIYT